MIYNTFSRTFGRYPGNILQGTYPKHHACIHIPNSYDSWIPKSVFGVFPRVGICSKKDCNYHSRNITNTYTFWIIITRRCCRTFHTFLAMLSGIARDRIECIFTKAAQTTQNMQIFVLLQDLPSKKLLRAHSKILGSILKMLFRICESQGFGTCIHSWCFGHVALKIFSRYESLCKVFRIMKILDIRKFETI